MILEMNGILQSSSCDFRASFPRRQLLVSSLHRLSPVSHPGENPKWHSRALQEAAAARRRAMNFLLWGNEMRPSREDELLVAPNPEEG